MSAQIQSSLVQRLEHLMQSGPSPDVAVQASRLIQRLTVPARVAIIGRLGSGKSTLAALLAQQTDLPAFEVSELTLVAGLTELSGSATHANIVLWCCQEVDIAEITAWAKLPSVIKDHSFLILTKADLLAADGHFFPKLQALESSVAEEFHSLFPLATLQAITASEVKDTAAFRASGAASLVAALQHQLRLDRGACRDSTSMFLQRYEKADSTLVQAPKPATPVPGTTWAKPLEYLQERAKELRQAQNLSPDVKIRTLLDHCCDTADGLAALVGGMAGMSAEDAARTAEILGVADTAVLLRLEGRAGAAVDAMAILLQLRRDMAQWAYS